MATKLTQKQRLALVKELALAKTYQRTHTPTGTHRRLLDPKEKDPPDMSKPGTRRRLNNLHPHRKKKGPEGP